MCTRFVLATVATMTWAGLAHGAAIPLTLTQAPARTLGPQSASAPCIIAGTQCQNPANFPFTNFQQGGNISAFDEQSPVYGIELFPYLTFDIAVDVNTNAAASETLDFFGVFVDADGAEGPGGFEEIYAFTGPTIIGDASNAGNGFGDWTLGTVDLSSYGTDALVQFQAVWSGAVAGAESFFLVSADATPVSEPGTMALMALGLIGLGMWRRRAR